MRILRAFAIRDTKANCFPQPPIFFLATGEAIRAFTQAVNDKTGAIGQYPADYTLFEIGTFNQDDGTITPRPEGILDLGNGFAYLNPDNAK